MVLYNVRDFRNKFTMKDPVRRIVVVAYFGNVVLFLWVCTQIFFILIKQKVLKLPFYSIPKHSSKKQIKFNVFIMFLCVSKYHVSNIISEKAVNAWGWGMSITDLSNFHKSIFTIFLNTMLPPQINIMHDGICDIFTTFHSIL